MVIQAIIWTAFLHSKLINKKYQSETAAVYIAGGLSYTALFIYIEMI